MRGLRAAALLLLSPGIGGAAVRASHACPTAAIAATAAAAGDQHAPAHHQHRNDEGAADCQCIGSCSVATAAVIPTAPTTDVAVAPVTVLATPVPVPTAAPRTVVHERQPPSTAPPLT